MDYVLFSLSVQRMSYYCNSLATAHTKMGGPTFVNEKVVHILEKKILVLNFEQKCDRDYYYINLN